MHNVNSPELTEYLFTLATKYDDPIAIEMEKYGRANKFPIIDRAVGVMLYTLTKIAGAKKVFELGSGYGYSAYWFAKAMGPDGKVWCTDGNPQNKEKAENYLTKTGLWPQINFMVGDAVTCLNITPGDFDIIYNDVDKEGYPACWEAAKARLKSGGLYICDNTLWSGEVYSHLTSSPVEDRRALRGRLHPALPVEGATQAHTDKFGEVYAALGAEKTAATEAIILHNKKIYEDKNFDTTLIPLRDGVIIARKR